MRAHLMITGRCSPYKVDIVLFHIRLIVYLASALKSWGDNSWETTFTIHSESTQNIPGNVKIRPKKILQSTILQRHLIKHSLARNPELQNDLFFLKICYLESVLVQILKDKYTRYEAVDCYVWRWRWVCENSICTRVGSGLWWSIRPWRLVLSD